MNWLGFYEEIDYEIEYQSRDKIKAGNTGDRLYYPDPLGVRHYARTLPEAMALAQADYERRLAESLPGDRLGTPQSLTTP
jgi:hypothetical protein